LQSWLAFSRKVDRRNTRIGGMRAVTVSAGECRHRCGI